MIFLESLYDHPHTLIKEKTGEISDYQIHFLIPIKWEFISMAIRQKMISDSSYAVPSEIKEFLITYTDEQKMIDALKVFHSGIFKNSEGSNFFKRACEDNTFLFRWNLKRISQLEKKLSCFALDIIADFTSPKLFSLLCTQLQ
jgi:hypothetical protein